MHLTNLPPTGFRRFKGAVGPVLGLAQRTHLRFHSVNAIRDLFYLLLLLDPTSFDVFKAFPSFGEIRQFRKPAK